MHVYVCGNSIWILERPSLFDQFSMKSCQHWLWDSQHASSHFEYFWDFNINDQSKRERPHPDYHCYSWHWHLTESVIHEKDPVMAWGLKRSHRHWVYTWPDPEPGVCIIMGSSLNVNSNILDQKFIQYQGLVMRESSFYEYFRADSSLRETPAFGHNLDPWI